VLQAKRTVGNGSWDGIAWSCLPVRHACAVARQAGKEIDDKKQISFADKEARIMGKKGDFDYSYNGQISVDEDNQIIVGQHLTQKANDKQEVEPALEEKANDKQEVEPALEEIKETT